MTPPFHFIINGDRLEAFRNVKLLSAKLRCRRNRHLDMGRMPMEDSRFEELPRGVLSLPLEPESAEDLRSFGVPVPEWVPAWARLDPCLEREGRVAGPASQREQDGRHRARPGRPPVARQRGDVGTPLGRNGWYGGHRTSVGR